MSLENLKDLFEQELKDLYHAEGQIIKALPKMVRAATEPELKQALQDHLQETEGHKQRLEQIFDILGMPARGKPCEGMKGIIEEGDEVLDEAGEAVMDAALIAAAQKVEHYEIASYGCVRTYAQALGQDEIASLLEQTLEEEKAADVKLTEIATTNANRMAEEGESEDEDEESSRGETEDEESESGSRQTAGVRGKNGGAKAKSASKSSSQSGGARRRDRSSAKSSR
jgi:ferritin-like metal-binding protein YciE